MVKQLLSSRPLLLILFKAIIQELSAFIADALWILRWLPMCSYDIHDSLSIFPMFNPRWFGR